MFSLYRNTSIFKTKEKIQSDTVTSVPCSIFLISFSLCLFLILNCIYKYGKFPELILSHFYHFCNWCKIISNFFVLLIPFSDVISQIKKSSWQIIQLKQRAEISYLIKTHSPYRVFFFLLFLGRGVEFSQGNFYFFIY